VRNRSLLIAVLSVLLCGMTQQQLRDNIVEHAQIRGAVDAGRDGIIVVRHSCDGSVDKMVLINARSGGSRAWFGLPSFADYAAAMGEEYGPNWRDAPTFSVIHYVEEGCNER
jgi:hypothetical protein